PSLSRRPATTTFAPALASARAAALPIPDVPPVTTATLFCSEAFILLPFISNCVCSCIASPSQSLKSYDLLVVIGFCDKHFSDGTSPPPLLRRRRSLSELQRSIPPLTCCPARN